MGLANRATTVAIAVGIGVIVVTIVATILAGSTILGSGTLGSFTGYVAIAVLVPLVLISALLFQAWKHMGSNSDR